MANRIKGITVEIGGDTTKLSKALEGVNKNIKNTQTQLKDVQKLLKLDPSNTELLSQKHKLLADAVKATKEKLETLKTAAEQANQALANGDAVLLRRLRLARLAADKVSYILYGKDENGLNYNRRIKQS